MLRLENLKKTFTNPNSSTTVLNNLTLKLERGSFNVLIGGNGCGKSTLLSLITGSQTQDCGQILLDDEDLNAYSENKRFQKIAMIHQNTQLGTVSNMSVLENLALAEAKGQSFGLQLTLPLGYKRRLAKKSFYQDILCELNMGLENKLDLGVKNLSGGQRQALSLAMSLLSVSKLLLLDEHTAALDPKTSESVMTLTDRFVRKHQLTTLMVTHDLEQASCFGDRLLLLKEGEIALDVSGKQKKALQAKDLIAVYTTHTKRSILI
jgi:putative ABC transport system ATP-binding protein